MKHAIALSMLLAAALSARPASAASERIFANGFEPCCRIGGTLSGLGGSGLVLYLYVDSTHSQETDAITRNGLFDFITPAPSGSTWLVLVYQQPAGQTCSVANGAGTMGNSDVDTVVVTCGNNLQWDSGHWGQHWN